ncbi:MAG TPA: bifunctional UDP-N-acetylglucosamine diphosphorylase/glucosamine-1-phosphate N-acetyltransferase GlmU, partial [Coriobacteriia bacterium]|nr:bifunctional UDP-N-acetylglucosamine diphosphorylase/glucosamine-1-phosphate N-acetyltransferase GlmU [Coriobacteriia bacterium]
DRIVVVTGHRADVVESLVDGVEFVRQDQQLGTGHAVMCARDVLDPSGSLLVLPGDSPLIRPETLRGLVAAREEGDALAVLTARMDDPTGYGRIIRGADGAVTAILEQADCCDETSAINEVNTGTYCFDAASLLVRIDRLGADNAQREFYLTDMVALFAAEGLGVVARSVEDPLEALGVNSRLQLAEATRAMQTRINLAHMAAGVTMVEPDLVWIGPRVGIGPDSEIWPMTFLMGETKVGSGVRLGPDSRVSDSVIGDGAVVDSSVVTGAEIGPGACVGPVAYLRPGTVLRANAKAGTCVEIKNSTIGEGSKVPHLSYIGDATIGAGVNVGAGTITCNYDGFAKHRTVIEDGAFIGSDTMLVAPVTIGAGALTAAASAISRDVPPGSLAIERSEQREISDWVARRRAGMCAGQEDADGQEGDR